MILSCSSCGAKYLVDAHQVKYGRHVKCFRCGHVWFHENKEYDPQSRDQIETNIKSTAILSNNDDSNLPAIYKKKNTVPLPFILLIFLVIFSSIYMISENLSQYDTSEFTEELNQLIDLSVRKLYYFLTK